MLSEIRTPEDLPYVQEHLQSLGPITIRLVKERSLCVVLDCETSESVEKLWVDYKRGKLKSLFTDDIGTDERLQRYGVSAVSLEVSLPRWQYRRAVVQLKYLKEGYEPKDVPSDLCQICRNMVAMAESSLTLSVPPQKEGDITSYVAVELERSISESDKRKAGLTKTLGGDGTIEFETAVQTTDTESSTLLLFKVQTPKQLSALAEERPEILGLLGINRYLNLHIYHLSRVRSREAEGDRNQYDENELKKLVKENGIEVRANASEALALYRDSAFTETVFRILESPPSSSNLHAITQLYDEHVIRQRIERKYTILNSEYETLQTVIKEDLQSKGKLQDDADKLTIQNSKVKGKNAGYSRPLMKL
ncbi:uncharacterized protein [Ptychodera flava]|uniref:uncharacterized protein n=1 Tax=Ptychodera flava TaxID=63121 RepID=UPI00396A0A95